MIALGVSIGVHPWFANVAARPRWASMVIGVLQVELGIDGARSLKDKRRVVSSLKDRLHRHHQVSVAEVGSQDDCQVAIIGIVLASSDVSHCQSVLDRILVRIRDLRGCALNDQTTEILTGR
ncbi:MAG: hypothetical protein CMJ18_08340 [Phycisphaeraceae bacterium]|nr:hypothetical protein [Phycisphaeraceae bacterium]